MSATKLMPRGSSHRANVNEPRACAVDSLAVLFLLETGKHAKFGVWHGALSWLFNARADAHHHLLVRPVGPEYGPPDDRHHHTGW